MKSGSSARWPSRTGGGVRIKDIKFMVELATNRKADVIYVRSGSVEEVRLKLRKKR